MSVSVAERWMRLLYVTPKNIDQPQARGSDNNARLGDQYKQIIGQQLQGSSCVCATRISLAVS